ncbi:MAG TPA: alpha/beta fold hydrolase [Actinomycetota bacterium]|nr:alpha/beta fold hydrolase [Actinomycetota bacterium]
MKRERPELRSADGLSLEAELWIPDDPRAGLVFCHPHPQMGGTMNAPLLLAVTDELVKRDWAVLRFNFRGIGESEGEASTGRAEVADAEGAVKFMRERFEDLPVAISGWSFGAAVATRVASADDGLAALVAIAPAVKEKPGITDGLPPAAEIDLKIPALVLCAVNDELVDVEDGRRWAETAQTEFYAMPGANHFFWAKYDKLAKVIVEFLVAEV